VKIGILSDAHGNHIGFDKCINYLSEHSDVIYYLGDAVGYQPFGNVIIDKLRRLGCHCLLGNHESMLVGQIPFTDENADVYKIEQCRKDLSEENISYIQTLLPYKELKISHRKILFVHGDPINPLDGYVYPNTDLDKFGYLDYDVVLMGHTHRPFKAKVNKTLFVNVGSCGLPRDVGNKMSFAVLNTDTIEVELKDIRIDTELLISTFAPFVHSSVIELYKRR